MKENNILDDIQSTYDFNDHLEEDESIVWSGKSHPGFVIASLESPVGTTIAVVILISVFASMFFIWNPYVWMLLLIGVLLLVRPEIQSFLNRRMTRYALSNKRLFFKLWSWTGTRTVYIWLDKIDKVAIDEAEDGVGTLHFSLKKDSGFYKKAWYSTTEQKPKFTTRNAETLELRHYPTYEFLLEANEVREVILEQQKELLKLPSG